MTLKLCGSVSVAIPVELRQPRANSLTVGGDSSSLGGTLAQGQFGKVDTASEEVMPKLGAAAEPIGVIFSGIDPLQ